MDFLSRMGRRWLPIGLAVVTAALVACGGNGDDDDDNGGDQPNPTQPRTLSGVAATGAAFTDAVVRVHAADGSVAGTSAPVGRDGTWQVTLAEGAKAPFVIIATRQSAVGETESLVSLVDAAPPGTTHVNVTPVTTLVAARVSPSGQPTRLPDEVKAGSATVDGSTLAAKTGEIKELLAPVLAATNTTSIDPFRTPFTIGSAGYDQLIDALLVTITPTGAASANIDISMKASGDAPAPRITFSSEQSLATIKANNSAVINTPIPTPSLPPVGIATLIEDLTTRMNACYALPTATRVSGTTAASVSAPACRTLFVGDDPTTYRGNGGAVSSSGSFSSLFPDNTTNLRFDQGSYEFTRGNGDIVVGLRSVTSDGAQVFDTFVVRNENGKLKLIGNQYQYNGAVNAFHQYRTFPTLNQSAFNYYSSGYTMTITNTTTSNGVPIFDRVVVDAPNGETLTLRPSAGSSFLTLVRADGSLSGTSVVRIASSYENAGTAGSPATRDTAVYFSPQQLTDPEIAVIPQQAVWTFRYYLASNPTVEAARQTYRTRARALTIAELKATPLPRFTSATLNALTSGANADGSVPMPTSQAYPVSWEVPTGALAPTQVQLFGVRVIGTAQQSFNDAVSVASTARSVAVTCSPATAADQHCNGSNFAANDYLTGVQMSVNDRTGRVFNVHANAYRLP
ncbi:hypothetical protein [Piscinibacter koreensis]|uniref:Bacterial Ig domain-containing protein n=1 Tax=Piscinibacter koreensis TaxID=2742824 RepID=A0A7Y6NK21_9BURK|nr:hypothetical protein [Schlegelella koreensis]NUZ04628.1 hypothetical protein [Schlegelella koreensis]